MPAHPSSTLSPVRSGVPLLILAGVLWGTGGLLGEALHRSAGMAPAAVAAYRLACGGALLCCYLLATGRRVPRTRAAWTRVAAIGGLAAVFQACYFTAVAASSVSVATLLTIGSAPVVVLVAEVLSGRRPGRRQLASVALAVLGLLLLVGTGTGPVGAGPLFAVLAGAGFAAVTLLSARPVDGLDAATTTGVGFVIGGGLLVPFALVAAPAGLGFAPSVTAVVLLVALAAVPTAAAYTAYLVGLRSAPAGVGAVAAVLEPLTAALLAALLLGERLDVAGWTGAVVLGVSVVLGASAGAQSHSLRRKTRKRITQTTTTRPTMSG